MKKTISGRSKAGWKHTSVLIQFLSVMEITQSFIPAPVQFEGMPNSRRWAFEDARTNFSYIKTDTTELSKLLLIEFGLIYANDWYLIPAVW